MTIDISANNPRISYSVAAGVTQTSFAVPFEFFDDSDLNVYIDTTLQTITTDYTVTGGAGSTGTVTMTVTGPKTVIFTRDTTIERTTDFTAGVDINRAALNTQLDTLTAISADNKDLGERSIRITDYDPAASNLLLPDAATRADKLLSFDTEGDVSVQSASDLLTGSILGANYTKASYTGNGTQTAYSTVESAGSKNNIQVYVDGVYQNKDTFSISGSTLTFTEAPPLNSAIEFIVGNAVTSLTTDPDVVTYNQGGTGAQDRTLTSKLQEYVTVKDFGAVGDGVVDDTAAIQAALDFTRTSGVTVPKKVLIPSGEYKITSTLDVPGLTSLVGAGQSSILRCYSCNGLNMESSNGIGPSEISNFWLYANGGENFTAIVTNLDSTSAGPRLQGRIYKNLYMSFWGLGMYQRGAWHTTYQSIRINQCYSGIEVQDQNVKLFFNDIVMTRGTITGTGTTIGFHVGSTGGPSATRPEDVFIQNSLIYGYEQAIYWRQCLFGGVLRCDLDACVTEGIRVVTADGGFIIRDNWIQVIDNSGTYYGIILQNLGYTPEDYNISIENNKIGLTSTAPTIAWAIYLGAAHRGVSCRDNSIQGDWQIGIRADASVHCRVVGNNVGSTTSYGIDLRNTTDTVLSENYAEDGITLLSNTRLKTGSNSGLHNTSFSGDISVPSGTTTATVTFSSLSLPDLPNGTYSSFVFFNNPSSTTRNEVWGTVSATGITYYLETTFGTTANIQFRVEVG